MHTINLNIENEKELYNPFDTEANFLSEDIKSYITNRMADKSIGEEVKIRIISPCSVNQERIKKAFHRWVDEEENAIKKEFRKNFVQQIWMFAIGVVFIAMSLFLENKIGVKKCPKISILNY